MGLLGLFRVLLLRRCLPVAISIACLGVAVHEVGNLAFCLQLLQSRQGRNEPRICSTKIALQVVNACRGVLVADVAARGGSGAGGGASGSDGSGCCVKAVA